MILRCEKTGKLLFSEAEAKLHADETGLSAFAQVSPEEKVWVCEETGKVCFNEQQMDMHKRRVPEAVTWKEQTVADMHEAQEKKKADEATDMETEEDQLLRAAGKAPKGKGKAKAAGPPVVTKEVVDQLVEMGFTEVRAQKALVKTSNAGIEGAINWLTEHLEDADIDDADFGEFQVKTQDELGQMAAEAMSGMGSGLTAEEKKAKLDEMLAKARAKKLGTSVEEEKQKERARRDDGKKTVQSKRDLEDEQRKRDMEARKREKREFEEEKAKLREKLAADREEKIKNGLLKPAAPKKEGETVPLSRAGPPPEPPKPKKPMTEREKEAMEQMAAMSGSKRNYEEDALSLEDATAKLCAHSDTKVRPALDLMQKMVANIAKGPVEEKYRKLRLSNAKVGEGLVFVPGARQYLVALGWRIIAEEEGGAKEFIVLPVEGDGVAQAQAQQAAVASLVQASAAAVEKRRREELDAKNKAIKEKAAKEKAERDAMKAAMARDRAEVAARGPSQASVAKKLPTESGGTMTSAIFSEQEEAEGRRNAQ